MNLKVTISSLFTLGILASFVMFICLIMLYFLGTVTWPWLVGLTILFNFIMWLISPWISDWIYKWFYKCKFYKYDEIKHHSYVQFIRKVCDEHKINFPKIGITGDQNPTAFTYGSGAYNARIIITEGIFKYCNEKEVEAVLAHELGHIVHRDFIIMTIAATMLEILYEIYVVFTKARSRRRSKSKGGGGLAIIGLISYFFYWIGTYVLLFLSRVREYYADEFSAQKTGNPNILSSALIKIAYGIAAVPDTEKTAHLLKSSRALGIFDFKSAKEVGLIHVNTKHDKHLLENALLFDIANPWASLSELGSTHPLIGKRIKRLCEMTSNPDFRFSELSKKVNKGLMWRKFIREAIIYYSTHLTTLVFFIILLYKFFTSFSLNILFYVPTVLFYLVTILVLTIIKIMYMFPSNKCIETDVLHCMGDLYASPVRGKPVQLQGKTVGRGIAGYIFGEDMMFRDNTGLIYLNYESIIPFFGNLFFGWKKFNSIIGKAAIAKGWFFRSATHHIALKKYHTQEQTIHSYVRFWSIFGIFLKHLSLVVLAGFIFFIVSILSIYSLPIYDLSSIHYKTVEAQGVNFDVPVTWEFRAQAPKGTFSHFTSGLSTEGELLSDQPGVLSFSIYVEDRQWIPSREEYLLKRHISDRIDMIWRDKYTVTNITTETRIEKKVYVGYIPKTFYLIRYPVNCYGTEKVVFLAFKSDDRKISEKAYSEIKNKIETSMTCAR